MTVQPSSGRFVYTLFTRWSKSASIPSKSMVLAGEWTSLLRPRHFSSKRLSARNAYGHNGSRFNNHTRRLNTAEVKVKSQQTNGASETSASVAYQRLRPVINNFQAPVDWAVAYGSGVIHQANAAGGEPPLTDFILSTPSSKEFHKINMRQNPSHYPFLAPLLGAAVLGWLHDSLGAGVWYVTMVDIEGIQVKYGVISTKKLIGDLKYWETLYVAGRLHKPVLVLQENEAMSQHFDQNLRSALSLALLLLPPEKPFAEFQLWEQIAGISYSGDPRMAVPGAENPQKVKNIVRGTGALQGFREKYQRFVKEVGELHWDVNRKNGISKWVGNGEERLSQSSSTLYLARLLSTLPITLRKGITKHFRPTIVGSLVSPEVKAERATSPAKRRRDVPDEGDLEFWIKVVEQDRFREVISNELRHIIRRPALTQSLKGILTAGFIKSVLYSLSKFRKWLAGRRK